MYSMSLSFLAITPCNMAARSLLRRAIPALSIARSCSSSSYVTVDVSSSRIASVSMGKSPANALDSVFFRQLQRTFEKLEKDKVAGVILTSSLPKIFCGGLDIVKLSQLKSEEVVEFASSYYDCWQMIYEFPLPTAAAITGHAPALGCLLAMVCEHRVMVQDCGNIGLNEMAFGLPPDRLLVANFRALLPARVAEEALLVGRLFSPPEALKVGLIDELSTSRDDATTKCEEFIKRFGDIPAAARGGAKRELRRGVMRALDCPDRRQFIELVVAGLDTMHRVFGEYAIKLKSRRK